MSAGTENEIPSYSVHESKNETGYYREKNGSAHISIIYLKDSTNWQKNPAASKFPANVKMIADFRRHST